MWQSSSKTRISSLRLGVSAKTWQFTLLMILQVIKQSVSAGDPALGAEEACDITDESWEISRLVTAEGGAFTRLAQ